MKTGISYRRVSTDEQADKGYSLAQQTKAIEEYAAAHNIKLVDGFYDDYTGSSLDRPGLQSARRKLKTVDCFICWDSDRLTREPAHYMLLRDELKDLGCELHYANRGRVDLNDFGQMLVEDFYGRFAHEWKRKLIENCTNGRREMAAQGHVVSHGQPPYGYRDAVKDGYNTLEIYEPEAKVIRLIFRLYTLDDMGYAAIAQELTRRKIPTPSDYSKRTVNKKRGVGEWSTATIQRIIKRKAYTGIWEYSKASGNPIAVSIPAIISVETYRTAQAIRQAHKGGRLGAKFDYLLSGRGKCEHCDAPIGAQSVRWESKNARGVTLYYKCMVAVNNSRVGQTCDCPKKFFNATKLETAVWEWVSGLLLDDDKLREGLQRYKDRNKDAGGELKRELARLDSTIAKQRGRLDRARALYLDGDEEKAFYLTVKRETEAVLSQLESDREETAANLTAASLTPEREASIYALQAQVKEAISLLNSDPDFALKRRIINALDVQYSLGANEAGQQAAHASCILDFNALLNLHADYTSSGTYIRPQQSSTLIRVYTKLVL